MNVPSYDIKAMLTADAAEDSAFATMLTTFPMDRAVLDESKSNCSRILDFSGRKPQLTMDLAKYEFPTVQITVKCIDYDEGWAFLSYIIDLLHGRAHEELNGAYYSLIECLNGPTFLKRENQRTIFVANFMIQRREI